MEADWEIEFGGDAAVIEPLWASFIDLRLEPGRINELSEVRAFPPLGAALLQLNAENSPVWTAKCDFWPQLEPGTWDPDEMEAGASDALHAAGCYIDLLARNDGRWKTPDQTEQDSRSLCARLHAVKLSHCRIDLIVRNVWMNEGLTGNGITAYATACGNTQQAAQECLAAALAALIEAIPAVCRADASGDKSTVQ